MKITRTIFTLLFVILLLTACRPKNEWTTYQAESGTLVNLEHFSYSFEYPSNWVVEEGVNHIAFASDAKLLNTVPDTLSSGQIIASLSININMSPQKMVETAISPYQSFMEFNEPVTFELNSRPAAYQDGIVIESGDQFIVIAVDMGENMRGLLTASIAGGELGALRETLMKIAESLRINRQ